MMTYILFIEFKYILIYLNLSICMCHKDKEKNDTYVSINEGKKA